MRLPGAGDATAYFALCADGQIFWLSNDEKESKWWQHLSYESFTRLVQRGNIVAVGADISINGEVYTVWLDRLEEFYKK
jgi:hypothetical protein